MKHFDQPVRNHIMGSLENVGTSKAVGYLPQATLRDAFGLSIETVKRYYEAKHMGVIIFDETEVPIESGAVYVYDTNLLEKAIERHRTTLRRYKVRREPDRVVRAIAKRWYQKEHLMMSFIRDIFGDA